jgi:hypothetical protein
MLTKKIKNDIPDLILVLCFILLPIVITGQTTDSISPKEDTIPLHRFRPLHTPPPVKDTLWLYKKIKRFAYKRRFTKEIYHAVFVDPAPPTYEEKPLSDQQKVEDPNAKFVGKYIRNIYVQVFDPFGYSVNDTTSRITNRYQKLGNKYHITTRHRIVLNLLLFKPDDTVELIKFTESERILREARYINDARIYILNATDSTDRVDVKVVVHDRWTLDAPVSGSFTGGHVTLRDRNLAGSGQVFEQYIGYTIPSQYYDFHGRYNIANIKRSFISSDISYSTTPDATSTGFSFDRPFFSPIALWAGGVSGSKTWGTYKYMDSTDGISFEKKHRLDQINYDAWVAFNYKPGLGKRKNRKVTNLVLALRYAGTRFQSRPSFSIDKDMINSNSSLYLGSVGYSLNKYYKDQYIFRFGANEDIPEGLKIQLLYGVLRREDIGFRYYNGIDIARGKHMEGVGYVSVNATYGTFYNRSVMNDATLNLGFTYFSDLLKSKRKWYFRQFAYFKYVYGVNKPSYSRITLTSDELYGFNSGSLQGTSKMLLNLEGVTYCPYNLIGFKIAPLLLAGLGALETQYYKLLKGPIYQAYAVGVLIRNENLLSSSFEVTYGLYPNLPDDNKKFYRFNPSISFKLKINAFDISKPVTVDYQ